MSLNTTESVNRLRFENFSNKLQRINTDVIHKIRHEGSLDVTQLIPDQGDLGCHFQDELERLKDLDLASTFKRFYYEIWPFVQSLAELLHHLPQVINIFKLRLLEVPLVQLPSFLQLLSVLARDLQDELQPHFQELFSILVTLVDKVAYSGVNCDCINSPNPDMSAKIFECMSHLIKFQMKWLKKDHDSMRQYYGPLLGHRADFIRDYAAKTFSILLRKLTPKSYQQHVTKIFKALRSISKLDVNSPTDTPGYDVNQLHIFSLQNHRDTSHANTSDMKYWHEKYTSGDNFRINSNYSPRFLHLLDGIASMLYFSIKGIKGYLHSNTSLVLPMVLQLLTCPLSKECYLALKSIQDINESSTSNKTILEVPQDSVKVKGKKKSKKVVELVISSSESEKLSTQQMEEIQILSETKQICATFIAGEVNRELFRLLTSHVRPSNSMDLWTCVLQSVDDIHKMWQMVKAIPEKYKKGYINHLEIATMNVLEILVHFLMGGKSRLLNDKDIHRILSDEIIAHSLRLFETIVTLYTQNFELIGNNIFHSGRLLQRTQLLFCYIWRLNTRHLALLKEVNHLLDLFLGLKVKVCSSSHPLIGRRGVSLLMLSKELLHNMPKDIIQVYLLKPMFSTIVSLSTNDAVASGDIHVKNEIVTDNNTHDVSSSPHTWLCVFLDILFRLKDHRKSVASPSFVSVYSIESVMEFSNRMTIDDRDIDEDRAEGQSGDMGLRHVFDECSEVFTNIINACITLCSNKYVFDQICSPISSPEYLDHLILSFLSLKWLVVNCLERIALSPVLVSAFRHLISTLTQQLLPILFVSTFEKSLEKSYPLIYVILSLITEIGVQVDANQFAEEITGKLKKVKKIENMCGIIYDFIANTSLQAILEYLCTSKVSSFSLWNSVLIQLDYLEYMGRGSKIENMVHVKSIDTINQVGLDSILSAMSVSLLNPSYWTRMCVLHIATRYLSLMPLSGSEDESIVAVNSLNVHNFAGICLHANLLKGNIETEREFGRYVGHLEVVMRSGKLSKSYIKFICSFCIGMLHYKYKSFWEPLINVVVSAVKGEDGDDAVWPLLLEVIEMLGKKSVDENVGSVEGKQEQLDILECLDQLKAIELGEVESSIALMQSPVFPFIEIAKDSYKQQMVSVKADARADVNTVYSNVWEVFRKAPVITLRRSKIVVPMFLRFLKDQYYASMKDDPEVPDLQKAGVFSNYNASAVDTHFVAVDLPVPILKKRLIMFLKVFAAVSSPKQLFRHNILYRFYSTILSKPDTVVSKLALDCVLTYNETEIVAYKSTLYHLLDDKHFRDELLIFNPSIHVSSTEANNGVDDKNGASLLTPRRFEPLHRAKVVPLMLRIVYGRFVSHGKSGRKAKEQGLARRNAVLSFLCKFPELELKQFVQLMLRGMLPQENLMNLAIKNTLSWENTDANISNSTESSDMLWCDTIFNVVHELFSSNTHTMLKTVSWERQVGFLHLLEQIVKIMGFTVTSYVELFSKLILCILANATSAVSVSAEVEQIDEYKIEEEEENDDEGDVAAMTDPRQRIVNQSTKVRALCLKRLSELVTQYHNAVDFSLIGNSVWAYLDSNLMALPSSIMHCRKPPALLCLIHSLMTFQNTKSIISSRNNIIITVINCVATPKVDQSIVYMLLDILSMLLELECGAILLPHSEAIIQCFGKKFVGVDMKSAVGNFIKLSDLKITPSWTVNAELKLLCAICECLFSRPDVVLDAVSVSNLGTLLLGMIRTYTTSKKIKVKEDWVLNVLRIYKLLLWRITDITPHVPFLSRLFGPASHSFSLFNNVAIRVELCEVYMQLAQHPSTRNLLTFSSEAIRNMVAMDQEVLEMRDYSKCMPVFQGLSATADTEHKYDVSWRSLLGPQLCSSSRDCSLCTVVVHECIRCMYDNEHAIRSAALSALKRLVEYVMQWTEEDKFKLSNSYRNDILNGIIMPGIHRGLKEGNDGIFKSFVVFLKYLVTTVRSSLQNSSCYETIDKIVIEEFYSTYHLDMFESLTHEDIEQDFFENIVHIQTHRRIRAIARLKDNLLSFITNYKERNVLESQTSIVEISPNFPYSAKTIIQIFLSMAVHHITCSDFDKKEFLPLMHEASLLIGAISNFLPWSQYYFLIKIILKILEKNNKREKVLLTSLCSVLDGFHFEITSDVVEGATIEELEDEVDNDAEEVEEDERDDVEVDKSKLVVEVEDSSIQKNAVIKPFKNSGIMYTSVHSIFPWVKVFLLKDGKDHKGNKTKTVQTLVAVALVKLLKRLQGPDISPQKKNEIFLNLVINVSSTLRSRDSDARDAARDSLAKMINTMGVGSLLTVLNELHHSFNEGYHRHVRNYSIRYLLNQILVEYSPPSDAPSVPIMNTDLKLFDESQLVIPEFDKCIAVIMECINDDMVGIANDDRDAEGAIRSVIREAKGNKAYDTLEICARNILFRPTYALLRMDDPTSVSSVHSLVSPLLDMLRNCDSNRVMRRVAEGLQRVCVGLSKNNSLQSTELLLYLHATLHPFVSKIVSDLKQHKKALGKLDKGNMDEEEDDDLVISIPSYLKEESSDDEGTLYRKKNPNEEKVSDFKVKTWTPFDRKYLTGQKAAIEERNREQRALVEVQDGASAPQLTGSNRFKRVKPSNGDSVSTLSGVGTNETDPAFAAAVKFCLNLLLACIKQKRLNYDDSAVRSMATPFLPLLGQCLRLSGSSPIVVTSMQCLCAMLSWGLPVEPIYSRAVGMRMLRMMYTGGVILSSDNELVQACVKGLTSLFDEYNKKKSEKYGISIQSKLTLETNDNLPEIDANQDTEVVCIASSSNGDITTEMEGYLGPKVKLVKKEKLPLGEDNIRSLLSLLHASILEITSSHQNSAFRLIRSIVDARVIVPEIYDLMNKLIEQIALSHRRGVRESSSNIIITFILHYPLGEKRLASHIKQIIQNCSFDYEEGRLSCLEILINLSRLLPVPILNQHALVILMPMTLRIVNDTSSKCRNKAAEVITALLRRAGIEIVNQTIEYALCWLNIGDSTSAEENTKKFAIGSRRALVRTGAQVMGILVVARPELLKKGHIVQRVVNWLRNAILEVIQSEQASSASLFGSRLTSLEKREMSGGHEEELEGGGLENWALLYHLMLLLERFYASLSSITDIAVCTSKVITQQEDIDRTSLNSKLLMELVQEAMLFPHAWVRAVAGRVMTLYCSRRDPKSQFLNPNYSTDKGYRDVFLLPNGLYQFARRLCVVLNQPILSSSVLESLMKCIPFCIQAMVHHKELDSVVQSAVKGLSTEVDDEKSVEIEEVDEVTGDEDDDDVREEGVRSQSNNLSTLDDVQGEHVVSSSNWLMQRLRGIGADSRGFRRLHVLKILSNIIIAESADFAVLHMKQLMEVALRARLTKSLPDENVDKAAKEAAVELLEALERKVGSSEFIGSYSEIQVKIESSKAEKKRKLAADAVANPKDFALRKIEKAEKKKASKKRKSIRDKGGLAKRRNTVSNSAILYEDL